jgi:fibronectin type 3 domain-containing protein
VSLSWTTPVNIGTSGITAYKIYRDTHSGATTLLDTEASTTSAAYTDTTAVHGPVYYYRVTAVNAEGESGYSNERTSGTASGRVIRLRGGVHILGGVRFGGTSPVPAP